MSLAPLALLAFLLQAPPATATAGQAPAIRGRITTANGQPLDGVLVGLKGSTAQDVTDAQGAFTLPVRAGEAGPFVVTASLPGYRSTETTVVGDATPLHLVLPASKPTFRTSVTVAAAAADPAAASRVSISPLDVVRTAGTQADIMRDLATMPGVTTIDGGTGLFVRGGDVSEVQVLFDGVIVSHPYRNETPSGGFRGAVDPFMTKDTTFTTGGFASPFGNALSAVVELSPQDRPMAPQMTASAGMAGVAMSAARPLGKNGGFRVAANRSTPSVLFSVNRTAQPFDRYPGGWEASGAWYLNSDAWGEARVFALHQADHVGVQIQHDAFTGFLHSSTTHTLVAAHWQKPLAPAWLASASAGTDRYSAVEDAGVMRLDNADANRSARFDVSGRVGGWRIRTGETAAVDRPDTIGRVPIAGGDFAGTGGIKSFEIARRDWTTGTFVDVTRTIGRLTPELGVRADYYSNARAWTRDPRAALVVALTARQRLRLALGRYHQAPSPYYFDRETGNAHLAPLEARHAIAGYEVGSPAGPSFLRVEAYRKDYARLPLQSGVAFDSTGYGRARGVDAFVTHAWPILTLRANSSWLTARRRWTPWDQQNTYPTPAAGTWRPDFDVSYTFEVVSTIKAPRAVEIATAWRTAAGRPSTPATGAVLTPGGYIPIWGPINSERLPRYERLDVSVSRSVRLHGRPGIAFVSVGNVLDRSNVSSYVYTADYSARRPVQSGSPRNVYIGFTIR